MAGVAEQRNSRCEPGCQRLAVIESPPIDRCGDPIQQARQFGRPALERVPQLVRITWRCPGFRLPIRRGVYTDEVEVAAAAADRVGDQVAVGTEPVAHRLLDSIAGHHRPVGAHTRESRRHITDGAGPDCGMGAVAAEHQVRLQPRSIRSGHRRATRRGAYVGHLGAQHHVFGRLRSGKYLDQVRSVQGVVRGAEPPEQLAFGEHGVVGPAKESHSLGCHGYLIEFFAEAQSLQHPSCIRSELDAGADFAELLRALDHLHGPADLSQGDRCSESTDAATDNNRPHGLAPFFYVLRR